MKRNCSHCGEKLFFEEESVAYYDTKLGLWSDTVLYSCYNCEAFQLITMPLGDERTRFGSFLAHYWLCPTKVLLPGMVPLKRKGTDFFFRIMDLAWAAQWCKETGDYGQATRYALKACQGQEDMLSSNWFAWAVSLAEKARDENLAATAETLLLKCHAECRKRLKPIAHRNRQAKVLLGILEKEVERLRGKIAGRQGKKTH